VIKSRKIRYGDRRGVPRILVRKPEGKDHLQDVDVEVEGEKQNGYSKSTMGAWTGLIWLKIGAGGAPL